MSILLYALAIPLSLWHAPSAAAVYMALALLWFILERRIEALSGWINEPLSGMSDLTL